jgi:hypothetical protein
MPYSADIRAYIKLLEADYDRPYTGSPNVDYTEVGNEKGEVTKVVANLTAFMSGKYTRLAKNIQRMQEIAQETLALEAEIKQDGREAIADLFAAEDAAYTRVVETVSFTLQITKDPKAATTVQYQKVLNELESHLTPELLQVLEAIKAKFSKVNPPKPPALTHAPREESISSVSEAPLSAPLTAFFQKFFRRIQLWGQNYDAKLGKLKASLGVHEARSNVMESISPDAVALKVWKALEQANSDIVLAEKGPVGASFTVHADGTSFEVAIRHVA